MKVSEVIYSSSLDVSNYSTNKSFLNKKNNESNQYFEINKKNILKGAIITSAIALGSLGFFTIAKTISKKNINSKDLSKINLLIEEMNKFPKDVNYRKSILKDMNLDENDFYKIRSIVGCQEFEQTIDKISKDKENFLPGIKTFASNKEALFEGLENVKTGKFAANLHLHTHYSDGRISVFELLEQAANYADKRVSLLGENNPFYLAITDHNTAKGCKEAIKIVLNNPEKYKNLRLILGIEHTGMAFYENTVKAPVETHMLSFGINPFNKALDNYLNVPVIKNKTNIQKSLNNANLEYNSLLQKLNINFSVEEMSQLFPVIDASPLTANYWCKDYMQFKLIYNSVVEKNEPLKNLLKTHNIEMDFTKPVNRIPINPDYSKGQKYFEYYHKAIKEYLESLLPESTKLELDKNFKPISQELYNVLNELEWKTLDSKSKLYIEPVTYPKLDSIIQFMKTQQDGLLGIAHPGVVFPYKNLIGNSETIKFYENLYRDFKNIGGAKAVFAEDNYAVYYNNEIQEILPKLAEISSSYGLKKTGGLDTHVTNIFKSK